MTIHRYFSIAKWKMYRFYKFYIVNEYICYHHRYILKTINYYNKMLNNFKFV